MAIKTDTLMMRYFVPFGYECRNERDFKKSVNLIKGKQKSGNKSKSNPDNDFFANINNLYYSDNPAGIGECIDITEDLPVLLSKDEKYYVRITDCKVYLNRNGMGILTYIALPDDSLKKDTDMLYEFQNSFKELTMHGNPFGWKREEKSVYEFIGKQTEKKVVKDKEKIIEIAEESGFDMSGKTPSKCVILENGKTIIHYLSYSDFHSGLWINGILNSLGGLHFMPERYKGDDKKPVPDKAIICNYAFFSCDSDEEKYDYIFCMTNGYNKNYSRTEDIENRCFVPFRNTFWYAGQEGMGQYVISDSNDKRTEFHRNLAVKRMDNYCYLYILVLQQYYSLLEYSRKIGCLSDISQKNMKKNHIEELRKYVDDMNIFFMKNTFPAVSHISHQNEVYKYLKDIYDINNFYEETKNGLEAVTDMLEKYDDKKKSDRFFLWTILGALFVATETLVNLSDIISLIKTGDMMSIVSTVVSMGALFVIALIVWGVWKKWKK